MWKHARAKKKLGHLRRLSGSPQVCFGQASGFECGMPSISNFQSILVSVQKLTRPCMRSRRGLCYCAHFVPCIPCSLFKKAAESNAPGLEFWATSRQSFDATLKSPSACTHTTLSFENPATNTKKPQHTE